MPREDSLILVVDSSGSMREMGKIMVARNLVAYVRECLRLRIGCEQMCELHLLTWGSTTLIIDLEKDAELSAIEAEGETNVTQLLRVLDDVMAGDFRKRVLLLSDGHLARVELSKLVAWRRDAPSASLRAVAIGPDANEATLRKIADANGVFAAEDISSCLADWHPCDPGPLPASLDDLPSCRGVWSGE